MTLTIKRSSKTPSMLAPIAARGRPIGIKNLADFFVRFAKFSNSTDRVAVYRGHPQNTFTLKPGIFRPNDEDKSFRKEEKNIFRELICLHPDEFMNDKSVFEQLVRMQHFSLPTRLLDVTFNPLVGLYFTCSKDPDKPGEFLRFSVAKRDMKYFDSDTVSCIANLSNLSGQERDRLRKIKNKPELKESPEGKRLLQFIKSEKPYFLAEIIPKDLRRIILVKPKQNNRRILAQQGAFFIFGLDAELKEDNVFGVAIERIPISAKAKKQILEDLDNVNLNDSSLFAEMEYSAKYIMKKLAEGG